MGEDVCVCVCVCVEEWGAKDQNQRAIVIHSMTPPHKGVLVKNLYVFVFFPLFLVSSVVVVYYYFRLLQNVVCLQGGGGACSFLSVSRHRITCSLAKQRGTCAAPAALGCTPASCPQSARRRACDGQVPRSLGDVRTGPVRVGRIRNGSVKLDSYLHVSAIRQQVVDLTVVRDAEGHLHLVKVFLQ